MLVEGTLKKILARQNITTAFITDASITNGCKVSKMKLCVAEMAIIRNRLKLNLSRTVMVVKKHKHSDPLWKYGGLPVF